MPIPDHAEAEERLAKYRAKYGKETGGVVISHPSSPPNQVPPGTLFSFNGRPAHVVRVDCDLGIVEFLYGHPSN